MQLSQVFSGVLGMRSIVRSQVLLDASRQKGTHDLNVVSLHNSWENLFSQVVVHLCALTRQPWGREGWQ